MKSDGTRRAIIIAVLCLFSIAMLFMTASAWGLKAFARFAEFMTGDRIFLRILAGIGFGGLSAAGVFALACTAKIGRIGNSKSSLNMLSGEPNGTTYISSSAVDGLVQNCVKKVASIKSCVSTISAADGQINIDLKLVVFRTKVCPHFALHCSGMSSRTSKTQPGFPSAMCLLRLLMLLLRGMTGRQETGG